MRCLLQIAASLRRIAGEPCTFTAKSGHGSVSLRQCHRHFLYLRVLHLRAALYDATVFIARRARLVSVGSSPTVAAGLERARRGTARQLLGNCAPAGLLVGGLGKDPPEP